MYEFWIIQITSINLMSSDYYKRIEEACRLHFCMPCNDLVELQEV